jgi:hypothetical protein
MVDYAIQATIPHDLLAMIVMAFRELRLGQTLDGATKVKSPRTVMSTAEAIAVLLDASALAEHFGEGVVTASDIMPGLVASITKEQPEDSNILREYLETVARERDDPVWQGFYQAGRERLGG